MANHPSEVDIIFVGESLVACAAAGRLAAANPELEILLVEQGPNNLNEPTVFTPGLMLTHLAPDSKSALFWQGNKSDAVNGRGPVVASGGILGGGSSAKILRYTRPAASDFDDWKTPGWAAKDLIPLLRKIETYHLGSGLEVHGYNGPIHVSYSNYYFHVAQEYLDVITRRGVPLVEDLWDLKTGHGCQRLPKYIHPTTGRRQDAAHCYIHPQASNTSLHVLTKTQVVRVLFDGTKATGVQRSGIGCAERLSKLGVPVVSDLPDVGRHYEDHSSLIPLFHIGDDVETMDCIIEQDPGFMGKYVPEFAEGRGYLTSNANDAGGKLRPSPEELKNMGPAFQAVFKQKFEPAPDKPVLIQTLFNGFFGPRSMVPDGKRFMMIANIQAYPASRGHVYITSTDPYAAPDFDTGFLNEQSDVDVLIWAYKHCRFPPGSAAGCVRLDGPPSTEIEDLVYTDEDNAAVEEFIREGAGTTWHSIGTVPMRPKEQGGCVDSRLNVYGTTNLKVADLSIVPGNVGANTNSTALVIGEKAAILIAEDLGLNVP
ncbi:GMC oxidoreductase [Ceratobasidium sp. AG-Ba]|nr:GMC oxidoreductase [Ceratobasidium sp. AG-Ba]